MPSPVLRILVAEDNPLNLELIRDLLELDGHTVAVAGDGVEAVEQARRFHPDVVLMDVQLPRLDGLTATRQLRNDPATRAIPIIALTANAMADDRRRVLEAGCIGHLAKPINTERIGSQIRSLLQAHRAEGG